MEELQTLNDKKETATNSMVTFMALNTSGFQLIPATIIGVLAAAGSQNPTAIIATSIIASLAAPLFDGGARTAAVESARAANEQAAATYRQTVLTALQEVEDALVQLQGDKERLVRLREAEAAARNASLLANQRYQSGLIDFQTVLDTQRTLLSSQDSVSTVAASIGTDHIRLYKALGGGWTPDTGAPSAAR